LKKLAKENAKRLKDAERLATIGQIAGMVGHDIRNPLQSIVNELYCTKLKLEESPASKTELFSEH
jgi:phosphoglycerate-specific signal transduction histidine kinase